MARLTLGVDVGPNAIGWALINVNPEDPADSQLIDLGVRVFPAGAESFDTIQERSRNEDRRLARRLRRQIRRRAARRRDLQNALMVTGLWPRDPLNEETLYKLNPYELRARAIGERLEPFEIGRILLHLNQRRGFCSNRKVIGSDDEMQGMLAEIKDNARLREECGFATVGAWLSAKQATIDHRRRKHDDHVRKRYLGRKELEDEFEAIWAEQSKYHAMLTNELKYGKLGKQKYPLKPVPRHKVGRQQMSPFEAFGLYGAVFFQRTMYWPKSIATRCELESKQIVCPRGDRHAQRFRLLQELNNLRYTDPNAGEESTLSDGQRRVVLEYLSTRDKATLDQIKKKLGFGESVRFNCEREERTIIDGMITDHLMAAKVGHAWHERPEEERDSIVRMLLDNERNEELVARRLLAEYRFSPGQAETALELEFPVGNANLSLKAIDKLLPYLERGLVYQSESEPGTSALHAAGYLKSGRLRSRLFDKLPDPSRVQVDKLRIGAIGDPAVKRSLVELRKVVNALIRQYGKPDAVNLVVSRSLRVGKTKRAKLAKLLRKREIKRDEAAQVVRAFKVKIRGDAIIRCLLWQEQAHDCVYCGRPITETQLITRCVVDHILPYSRSLDDSLMNKIVCHRKCNYGKGNLTPYEWLADTDPDRYDRVCDQVKSLLIRGLFPYKKAHRFLQKSLNTDGCIDRQLITTSYIARALEEYLGSLFDNPHSVCGLKGQLTAMLRWRWGLDAVLQELSDSPAWSGIGHDLRPCEKDRADHRHHAIDAVVIALTNRYRLQQLCEAVERTGTDKPEGVLKIPWPNLRQDVVKAIRSVNVSHRVERKVAGKLHEDTLYGPINTPGEWVVRKAVVNLTPSEIERVRDDRIREIIVAALTQNGIEFGRGKISDAKKMKTILGNLSMPSGVPIKNVRLIKSGLTMIPVRKGQPGQAYVKPGAMHHLCIFEWTEEGKLKREAIFVTMLEAMNRLKRGEPIIQRVYPDRPNVRFLMSLSKGEMLLEKSKDGPRLLTFKTAASTQGQMYFAEHTDARRSGDQARFVFRANLLDAQKVTVDPLGRIRWAND